MSSGYLDIQDLAFDYADGTKVLHGLKFSVKKGEFVGVLGANGSGKTTLLKVLNRLQKPTSGTVLLEGTDIRAMKKDTFFTRMCTMFQNPDDQLFAPTVWEDVSFGPVNMQLSRESIDSRVRAALTDVAMDAYHYKAIHHLSYGQKKRVCLAGVLAMRPEIMLLDEPTSCLDPMGVSAIMQLLQSLNKKHGITMVMATHLVDLVPLFVDRVIVLHDGRIMYEGTPEEVFAQKELVRTAQLRLPRIGHLFEILREKDSLGLDEIPLTIGEAREAIKLMAGTKEKE